MFKNFKKGGQRKPSKSSDSSADASSKGIGAPGPGPTSKSGVGAPVQNTVEPVFPPPMTHVEPLPLLGKSPAAERQNLFMRKLQICCFQFDFTDTLKSAREKEIKRQTLLELVDFIQSGTGKVAEACLGEMIKMVGVNIFRCLPPASHESSGTEVVDPDEEENYSEPSWQHLQIVYELLLRGLLKYWPLVNCQKEVLFLGELEEVLEETQSTEFQRCIVPLFRKIARCLNSPHFQVAERALFFWNSEHIVSLIAENRQVILPIIFEALEKNIQSHWNTEVHGLTVNVRKMFSEMDAELVNECQKQLAEKQAKAREVAEQREMTWKKLEDAASK
ncbi:serine/threonine protein phosphatase 2A 57 kDa regulatory subunit B' beta isoform isoform X2 [Gossypium hirsutum]|uniref:Serine/threonine protein phosphatase 2A 57 kDa regulatory subunit B' beta isoform isoform X2 n=1 Tax=Gossypium hirsutum TaxID=3635 RepID=A0ABM2Z0J9_GOSHI|nr:serine/threonine protein phosphatase 2A 57 kDa regulatory subunit B' beta isoform-like isoform X2 [Gossypium hirsutum]